MLPSLNERLFVHAHTLQLFCMSAKANYFRSTPSSAHVCVLAIHLSLPPVSEGTIRVYYSHFWLCALHDTTELHLHPPRVFVMSGSTVKSWWRVASTGVTVTGQQVDPALLHLQGKDADSKNQRRNFWNQNGEVLSGTWNVQSGVRKAKILRTFVLNVQVRVSGKCGCFRRRGNTFIFTLLLRHSHGVTHPSRGSDGYLLSHHYQAPLTVVMSLSDLKLAGRHGDSGAGDGLMPCTFDEWNGHQCNAAFGLISSKLTEVAIV